MAEPMRSSDSKLSEKQTLGNALCREAAKTRPSFYETRHRQLCRAITERQTTPIMTPRSFEHSRHLLPFLRVVAIAATLLVTASIAFVFRDERLPMPPQNMAATPVHEAAKPPRRVANRPQSAPSPRVATEPHRLTVELPYFAFTLPDVLPDVTGRVSNLGDLPSRIIPSMAASASGTVGEMAINLPRQTAADVGMQVDTSLTDTRWAYLDRDAQVAARMVLDKLPRNLLALSTHP